MGKRVLQTELWLLTGGVVGFRSPESPPAQAAAEFRQVNEIRKHVESTASAHSIKGLFMGAVQERGQKGTSVRGPGRHLVSEPADKVNQDNN
jgi:hypothetical protein